MALTFAFRGPGDWDSDTKGFEEEESENLKALGMHVTGDKAEDDDEEDEEEDDEAIDGEVKPKEKAKAAVAEPEEEEEVDELEELERLAKKLKEEEGSVGLDEGEE